MDESTLENLKSLREGKTLEQVVLKSDDPLDSESLHYTSNLVITYRNGKTQSHPLSATVVCPSFKIATEVIDFGIGFVGQELERQLTIVNRSGADTWWCAKVKGDEDNGEFRVKPNTGLLQAFNSHRAHNKAVVTVTFVAKNDGPSEATLVFKGHLNEPRRVLKVKGSGSFDGQYELK